MSYKDNLTVKQVNRIDEVAATMRIEHMPLTETDKENLARVATGEITTAELIEKIKHEHHHPEQ